MAAVLEQFRAQGHAFMDADVSGARHPPSRKKLEEARRLVQLELAALEPLAADLPGGEIAAGDVQLLGLRVAGQPQA
jgi:hypothetical protein